MSVIEIAEGELGFQEGTNNDTKYGKWYGLNYQPWCAMFVSWVFHKAGYSKYIAATNSKGFASCQLGLNWFTKKKKLVQIGLAQPGDLAFFQFDDDAAADHIGIVVKNNPLTKTLTCIEGNTSSGKTGSQANGDGVYKRKRHYKYVIAVARPLKGVTDESTTNTSTKIRTKALCSNCGQPLPSRSN
jgi:hypothetical protein